MLSWLLLGASPFALAIAGQASAAAEVSGAAAAPTGEAQSARVQVGEVVVTAERRSESLKNVPLSVQAVSAQQLAIRAVADTTSLAAMSPTLNFSAGNSAGATSFGLRGVSSVSQQNGLQPSTAMVVDGVAFARQSEFVMHLSDIDRIELLNGPQGTLFGKNSTAGVISIVTKQPSDHFEAQAEGLATSDSEYSVHALINLPLSSRARLRINGFYDDQSPLIENLGPARDVLGSRSYGLNAKLALDITDEASFVLSTTYSHTNSSWGQFTVENPGVFGAFQRAVTAPAPIERGTTTINTDEPAVDLYHTFNLSGTLNWRLSDQLNLTSITAYSDYKEESSIDGDVTPVGVIIGKGESTPGTGYPFEGVYTGLSSRFPDRFHYVSQEVRLNYVNGPLNAIVGGYFQDYHDAYSLNLPFLLDGSLLGLTPGVSFYSNQYPHARIHDTTGSIFGDATIALSTSFKIFGGVRYTHEEISVAYHRDDFFGPASLLDVITGDFGAPPVNTVDAHSQHKINNVSGRAGIQYQPTQQLNFYASYARGYKAPAADVTQTLRAGEDPIIKPEIADAYEVGAKLRLFENRVALNVALFDERIHGIQLGIVEPGQGGTLFTPVLINAGTLHIRGVEADGDWAATSHLRFHGGLAFNDATYEGFSTPCNSTQLSTSSCPNTPSPGFQDITGQRAIQSPKWKYSISADYDDRFPSSDLHYYAHIDWTYTSSIYYELGQDPLSREGGHGMLNASVGLKGPDNHWEVQLFAKNLTNEFYYADLHDVAVIGQPIGNMARDFQRYGGVKLTVRY